MTACVILLRGVNVGGANRLPMAALRTSLEAAGFAAPQTYLASGNVVVVDPSRASEIADRVSAVIADAFGLDVPAIAMTAREWTRVVDGLPVDEPDPKRVHAIAFAEPLTMSDLHDLQELQDRVDAKGARDRAVPGVGGRVLYLHTPGGFGSSHLAKALTSRRVGALPRGTGRNWSTVLAIQDLLASHGGASRRSVFP